MAYELQTREAPHSLAAAFGGTTIELRERVYVDVRDAIATSNGHATEAVLAASLYVDGQPVTVDALLHVPGRFLGTISRLLAEVQPLYGLNVAAPGAANDDESPGDSATKH